MSEEFIPHRLFQQIGLLSNENSWKFIAWITSHAKCLEKMSWAISRWFVIIIFHQGPKAMVGCDAPYWTSFSGLTWCLSSFTQWHLLILPKTQAFPQLSIGTAHGSWRSLWWFCCRILWLFFCINDQPCRISPKKKKIQIWKHFHQPTMVSWECRNRKKKPSQGRFPPIQNTTPWFLQWHQQWSHP